MKYVSVSETYSWFKLSKYPQGHAGPPFSPLTPTSLYLSSPCPSTPVTSLFILLYKYTDVCVAPDIALSFQ